LVGLFFLAPFGSGTTPTFADAVRIDRENCDQVAALLPPSVLEWVKRGELTLELGEMRDEVAWEPEFLAASEANSGRYDVDASGWLIERSTRTRPPHTYGFPFPRIDPADAQAGVEVMWNANATTYKFGSLHTPFLLHWIGREGFERNVGGDVFALPFDYQRTQPPNPEGTETRDLFVANSPASSDGIASLTWRYMDNRPDSVWGYLPAMRRVRQLTAANRSDPAYGSDITLDDGLLWLGKNQSFTWKLVGSQEVLVGTVTTSHVQLERGAQWEGGQEWLSPKTFPGVQFGWENAGWKGAPWMPTNLIWVRRPVWLVEGQPRDSYYSYGRQVFYIDQATFKIYYKVVYTPAGEYWKTLLQDLSIAVAPDGSREVGAGALLAVDDRAHHATYTRGFGPDFIVAYNSPRVQPKLFTTQGLLSVGK
jgi:hypothetical protein